MRRFTGRIVLAAMFVVACGGAARAMGPIAEAGLFIEQTDMGTTGDASIVGVRGYYAFNGLGSVEGPLNEALFLCPTPYAGAEFGTVSGEMFGTDIDGTSFALLGGFADPGVPVAVDLVFTMVGIDMTGGSMDMEMLELSAGYFVMPGMLVALVYDTSTTTTTPASGEDVDTAVGIAAKWVKSLGGGQAFNAELKYQALTMTSTGFPDEEGSLLEIGGDFYITQTIGIGLLISDETGDTSNDGGQTLEIRASVFVTPQVGLRVSHATYTPNATGADDTTVFGFGAFGRF